jgi:hypothetical protein
VIAEEGLAAEIVPVALGPGNWFGLRGSTSILMDGEELFPAKHRNEARSAPNCRIYATPDGPKNHPTAALVRVALTKPLSGLTTDAYADRRQAGILRLLTPRMALLGAGLQLSVFLLRTAASLPRQLSPQRALAAAFAASSEKSSSQTSTSS